jgi:subtilisin family serine protease
VSKSGKVADFSSRHPYLTLTAPGVNVPSLGRIPGEAYSGDGTSQATALASAAAALVWSKFPKLNAQQVLARLIATTDHHSATPSTSYGYGIVNPYKAITQTVSSSAPDPVYANAAPFMARAAVAGVSVGKVPEPAQYTAPPGTVRIASPSSRYGPQVVHGLLVAGLGLLLFLVLVFGGVRGSRRRRALAAAAQPPLPPPPPPVVDDEGVEWHQL